MLGFIFQLYFGNILLGIITFLICSYLLKKYLDIDVIDILKTGTNNIYKLIKGFKEAD